MGSPWGWITGQRCALGCSSQPGPAGPGRAGDHCPPGKRRGPRVLPGPASALPVSISGSLCSTMWELNWKSS